MQCKQEILDKPVVSIACMTFNHEKYIKRSIESFLNQKTDFKFEVVIGDGGSSDNSRQILTKYKNKHPNMIKLIFPEQDPGINGMFNMILSECSGKYIATCEGDDYWINEKKLQIQVDFLENHPDYSMTFSDIVIIDKEDNEICDYNFLDKQREKYKSGFIFAEMLKGNFINNLTTLVRADEYKDLIQLIRNENIWFAYDYWVWLTLSINTKIKYIDQKFAAYRYLENSLSRQPGFMNGRSLRCKFDAIKRIKNEKLQNILESHHKVITKIFAKLFKSKYIDFKTKLDATKFIINNGLFVSVALEFLRIKKLVSRTH